MVRNYYYLIAGLTDLTFDEEIAKFDAVALRDEIVSQIDKADVAYVDMIYMFYDIKNLIAYLRDSASPLNPLGRLVADDFADEMERAREAEFPSKLPSFAEELLFAYRRMPKDDDDEAELSIEELEVRLLKEYYYIAAKSKNRFIREWAEFDRTVRNITAAYVLRGIGADVSTAIIGQGDIEEALIRSGAADFGLKGEVDYIDTLIQVLEEPDLYLRELKMDNLYWNMADEITVFDYFTTDKLLAYLVKVNILYRWSSLDKARGSEILRRMLDSLVDADILAKAGV